MHSRPAYYTLIVLQMLPSKSANYKTLSETARHQNQSVHCFRVHIVYNKINSHMFNHRFHQCECHENKYVLTMFPVNFRLWSTPSGKSKYLSFKIQGKMAIINTHVLSRFFVYSSASDTPFSQCQARGEEKTGRREETAGGRTGHFLMIKPVSHCNQVK